MNNCIYIITASSEVSSLNLNYYFWLSRGMAHLERREVVRERVLKPPPHRRVPDDLTGEHMSPGRRETHSHRKNNATQPSANTVRREKDHQATRCQTSVDGIIPTSHRHDTGIPPAPRPLARRTTGFYGALLSLFVSPSSLCFSRDRPLKRPRVDSL